MIKKTIFFILLVCLLIAIGLLLRENIRDNPQRILQLLKNNPALTNIKTERVKDSVFKDGRMFILDVKYMWIIPMGEARMSVKRIDNFQGQKVYGLFATAQTKSLIVKFYNARAEINSYIDTNTFLPLVYTENFYVSNTLDQSKEIAFDQKKLIATREGERYKIVSNTFDPISAIYYLRLQDLSLNKEFIIDFISKEDIYEMAGKVIKKYSDISLVKIIVQRKNRSSSKGGKFYIWITDDAARLPLLIKAWTKAGVITARLIDVR